MNIALNCRRLLAGIGCLLALSVGAWASPLTLVVVDSFSRSSAFGLAFDGTNLWYAVGTGGGVLHEMTTAGVDTGRTTPRVNGGALGWDPVRKQLFDAGGHTITEFDEVTGANPHTVTVDPGVTGFSLIDGLGGDSNSGGFWFSPDVGNVYRLNANGSFNGPNPVIPSGSGGFSGVERIDTTMSSFLIVVNDASSPRQLCKYNLDGTAPDCTVVPNSRYEDLAFDGRFLYAADFFGNRIDKIDLLGSGGGSIFQPPGVPEPGSLLLVGGGLLAVGLWRKLRRGTMKKS